jgi:hypothetical protein
LIANGALEIIASAIAAFPLLGALHVVLPGGPVYALQVIAKRPSVMRVLEMGQIKEK